MKKTVLSLLLFVTSFAHAAIMYEGGVEALFWKTSHTPIPYAYASSFRDDGAVIARGFLVEGSDDWGVRAHFGGSYCSWFATGSYLYYDSSTRIHQDRQADFFMFGIQGQDALGIGAKSITTNLFQRYQYADVRVGGMPLSGRHGDLYAYGNGRWTEICFGNETEAVGVDAHFLQRARFSGLGLGAGLGARVPFWWGFGAHGRLGVMGIIGRSVVQKQDELTDIGTRVSLARLSNTIIVPLTEFKAGIDYTFNCFCLAGRAILGYELDYYRNSLGFSTSVNQTSTMLPELTPQDLAFSGLYIGLDLSF